MMFTNPFNFQLFDIIIWKCVRVYFFFIQLQLQPTPIPLKEMGEFVRPPAHPLPTVTKPF